MLDILRNNKPFLYLIKHRNKMKKLLTLLFVHHLFLITSFAQTDPREVEIRRLENIEREATMRGDSAILFGKIWSNEMVVNTPANRVGTVEGSKMQLRTGNLAYASFVRNIEKSLSTTTWRW
jgi:hypothetical protein